MTWQYICMFSFYYVTCTVQKVHETRLLNELCLNMALLLRNTFSTAGATGSSATHIHPHDPEQGDSSTNHRAQEYDAIHACQLPLTHTTL